MQKKICLSFFLICLAVLVNLAFTGKVSAQPSEAQLRKQLSSANTVSITFSKPGKIEWSSTYSKYLWTRGFTEKLKSNDPGIFVILTGYAAYDVRGGKYVYWQYFITSQEYEGIPNPTAADVQKLIEKFGLKKIMGNYRFNHVIGKVESIGLADEPNFEWHTQNSVSFNVVAVYTERTNDIGGKQRIAQTLQIRLYRDSPTAEWKDILSSAHGKLKH
jgi:hypothetical protein